MFNIIDSHIAKGREEGIQKGRMEGRMEGLEQGRAEGEQSGLEQGIRALIETLHEFSQAKDTVIQTVAQKFGLQPQIAADKVALYW